MIEGEIFAGTYADLLEKRAQRSYCGFARRDYHRDPASRHGLRDE
jgi:hypothetical protein